jgi:hypothetical protein
MILQLDSHTRDRKTLIKKPEGSRYTTIYLDAFNSVSIFAMSTHIFNYKTIEYLSIRDNFLKQINFIKDLPHLWYLDIRKNQVIYIIYFSL